MSLGPFDGTGRPYWKRVDYETFQKRWQVLFPRGHPDRVNAPTISVKNNKVVIHKDGEIYSEFKIEFENDVPCFYLHNYCFAV